MSTIIYGLPRKSKEKHIFTKEDPFLAPIKERYVLNKQGSCKKTFHISLDVSDSSIIYQEGDAIGIWPQNDSSIVTSLLSFIKDSKDTVVQDPRSEQKLSLEQYLYHKANLSRVSLSLLQLILDSSPSTQHIDRLRNLLIPDHKTLRAEYIKEHDVLTCLNDFAPTGLDAHTLVTALSPMLPRFYSIASSQVRYPHEIHLLVSTFSYAIQNEVRTGLGSHFLCYSEHSTVPLYVQHNPNFALPTHPETPILMIGPGTGIAPYRAFLQRRASLPIKTRNWLFFGECNEAYDFYYQKELSHYITEGYLKLSTAFSRDQPHKVYVQHRLLEQSREVWAFLQEGAYLYLCGDATHMAKDVTEALLTIAQKEGNLSLEQARHFFHHLRKEKRFQSDVY